MNIFKTIITLFFGSLISANGFLAYKYNKVISDLEKFKTLSREKENSLLNEIEISKELNENLNKEIKETNKINEGLNKNIQSVEEIVDTSLKNIKSVAKSLKFNIEHKINDFKRNFNQFNQHVNVLLKQAENLSNAIKFSDKK